MAYSEEDGEEDEHACKDNKARPSGNLDVALSVLEVAPGESVAQRGRVLQHGDVRLMQPYGYRLVDVGNVVTERKLENAQDKKK